jgi:hypothetical protein
VSFSSWPSTAFLQRYALILKATGVAGLIGLLMMALGSLLTRYSGIWSETVIEAVAAGGASRAYFALMTLDLLILPNFGGG